MAVSAAASVGVHIAQEGLTGQFISDSAVIRSAPFFEDRVLDALAVIRPSAKRSLSFKELRASGAGVIIAVLGKLSVTEAQQLAACRADGSQGIALLLDVSSWADEALRASSQQAMGAPDGTAAGAVQDGRDGRDGDTAPAAPATQTTVTAGAIPEQGTGDGTAGARGSAERPASAESTAAAAVLRSAGWHVTAIDAGTPLAVAWQRLPRGAEMLVAAAGRPDGSPA
jgi:hypothetical protein